MTDPAGVVLAPMRLEAWALRGLPVVRIGMGPGSATRAARAGTGVLAGVCGALAADLRVGDVVVAHAVGEASGTTVTLQRAEEFAAVLRRHGIEPRLGRIVSTHRVSSGRARSSLAGVGAIAVDMESAWVVGAIDPTALVVVRVVMDVADRPLMRPATAVAAVRALRRLGALRPAIADWLGSAETTGQRAVHAGSDTVQSERNPQPPRNDDLATPAGDAPYDAPGDRLRR